MSRTVTFTQAKVNRAVLAARKAGLRVIGIRVSDGVVLVDDGETPVAPESPQGQTKVPEAIGWDDV